MVIGDIVGYTIIFISVAYLPFSSNDMVVCAPEDKGVLYETPSTTTAICMSELEKLVNTRDFTPPPKQF